MKKSTELGSGLSLFFKDGDKSKPYLYRMVFDYRGEQPGWYWLDFRASFSNALTGVFAEYEDALLVAKDHTLSGAFPTVVKLIPMKELGSADPPAPTQNEVLFKDGDKSKRYTTSVTGGYPAPGWYWIDVSLWMRNRNPGCVEDCESPLMGPHPTYEEAALAADEDKQIVKYIPPSDKSNPWMEDSLRVRLDGQLRQHTSAGKFVLCAALEGWRRHLEVIAVADSSEDLAPSQCRFPLYSWQTLDRDGSKGGFVWNTWIVDPRTYVSSHRSRSQGKPTLPGWYWICYPLSLDGEAHYRGPYPTRSGAVEICGAEYEVVQVPAGTVTDKPHAESATQASAPTIIRENDGDGTPSTSLDDSRALFRQDEGIKESRISHPTGAETERIWLPIASDAEQLPQQSSSIASEHVRVADAYRLDCKFDPAIADASEAIRLDPNNAVAFGIRAESYRCRSEFERAIADATEAIRLHHPDPAFVYRTRGECFLRTKRHDLAIADACEAIRLEPTHAFAYGTRGMAFCEKSEFTKAVTDLTEAHRLDPDDGLTRINLEEAKRRWRRGF